MQNVVNTTHVTVTHMHSITTQLHEFNCMKHTVYAHTQHRSNEYNDNVILIYGPLE